MSDPASVTLAAYKRAWENMHACYLRKIDEVAELNKKIAELEKEKLVLLDIFWQSGNM